MNWLASTLAPPEMPAGGTPAPRFRQTNLRRLQSSVVAVIAGQVIIPAGMLEFLAGGESCNNSSPLPCARMVWQALQSLALTVRSSSDLCLPS